MPDLDPLTVLAAVTLVAVVLTALEVVSGYRRIGRLAETAPIEGEDAPSVAVVIAARDEARHIEQALASVLALDYPRYEVVVVDDRSSDETPAILARLAERQRANRGTPLRVVRVDALPDGWLGKTHAMQRGAEATRAELLLFTDADVVYEPSTLARAVRYVGERRLDHLALGPALDVPTLGLALGVGYFQLAFMIYTKPWAAPNPRSRRHIGIGAFNLIRAETWRRIGGFTRIALRPDDDVKLGKLVKMAGARQELVAGEGLVRVEWYRDFPELARGLRKNSFAGMEYSLALFLGAVVATLAVNVWPFVAAFVLDGLPRLLYAAAALVLVALYAFSAAAHRNRPWLAPLFPVAALMFLYIIVDATVRTLVQGGIEWRGTRYDLDALKANRV